MIQYVFNVIILELYCFLITVFFLLKLQQSINYINKYDFLKTFSYCKINTFIWFTIKFYKISLLISLTFFILYTADIFCAELACFTLNKKNTENNLQKKKPVQWHNLNNFLVFQTKLKSTSEMSRHSILSHLQSAINVASVGSSMFSYWHTPNS